MKNGPVQILVLEDSEADLHIIKASLMGAGLDCGIKTFTNGAEALDYIGRAASAVPDLVILDLHIPGTEGLSVLNSIRGNTRWAHVPVFIFTASQSPSDIARMKLLGSDRYVLKPMDLDGFSKFGQDVREWLEKRNP